MFGKTRQRLGQVEAALGEARDALERIEDTLNLRTPGGLSVVAADARAAKTAAESAFVASQTLASQATVKPGIPEVVKAVSAHTDALKSMEKTVRTATGPQPALTADVPAQPPVAPPAAPAAGPKTSPKRAGKM